MVQHASEALDELLGNPPEQSALAQALFPARMRAAEREVAAAGLDRFSDEELGDLVCELAAFSLGDDAERPESRGQLDSRLVESLDRALGRRTRRKIRRSLEETSLDQLRAIDFGAWRLAVRGLAAAVAVDSGEGDLRAALVALCREGEETSYEMETEDWTTRIQAEPLANELLRRVATSWCSELAQI